MPWIKQVFGQSDQCDDYHSTQAIVAFAQIGRDGDGRRDGIQVAEHGYTEAGEGKGEVDMSCGQGKQDLARDRDAGHDHETAEEIWAGLERWRRNGDVNVVMGMDREAEVRVGAPPIPGIHDFQHVEFRQNGDVVLREAWELGRGRVIPRSELEKHDQHKLGESPGPWSRRSLIIRVPPLV